MSLPILLSRSVWKIHRTNYSLSASIKYHLHTEAQDFAVSPFPSGICGCLTCTLHAGFLKYLIIATRTFRLVCYGLPFALINLERSFGHVQLAKVFLLFLLSKGYSAFVTVPKPYSRTLQLEKLKPNFVGTDNWTKPSNLLLTLGPPVHLYDTVTFSAFYTFTFFRSILLLNRLRLDKTFQDISTNNTVMETTITAQLVCDV